MSSQTDSLPDQGPSNSMDEAYETGLAAKMRLREASRFAQGVLERLEAVAPGAADKAQPPAPATLPKPETHRADPPQPAQTNPDSRRVASQGVPKGILDRLEYVKAINLEWRNTQQSEHEALSAERANAPAKAKTKSEVGEIFSKLKKENRKTLSERDKARRERDRARAERDKARSELKAREEKLAKAQRMLETPAALRELEIIASSLKRHLPAKPTEEALRRSYMASELAGRPDDFVLYRIIGNDLYPRHRKGQSRENVAFILENEPELENCEKRWVLNRIIDPFEREGIIALLKSHGQSWIEIPFSWDEYMNIGWDFEPLEAFWLQVSEVYEKLSPEQRVKVAAQLRRLKNNYVMNNNGARNVALKDGLARGKWVLPWDGNCFLTEIAWRAIRDGVTAAPWLKHFLVPMARVTDNELLLEPGFETEAQEEPQILFRCDSQEEFDARHPYGRRPKVDLFWRLGVPGPWDRWRYDPWDIRVKGGSAEAHQFGQAGWVARLASGQSHLEQSDQTSFKNRGLARAEAIVATIDHLDVRVLERRYDAGNLVTYSEEGIENLRTAQKGGWSSWRRHLLEEAQAALTRGPYSVTQKTTLAPSGDIHDYWHPAPYWHPNPDTEDGLPFIRKDGVRVPGTVMYEADSSKYDRTRLQMMFDDVTTLALGWTVTGDIALARRGAKLVRAWFLNRTTRMNPHLTYSQVRMGRNRNEGAHTGVIEMKDLYYLLDAVRLLERSGAFSKRDRNAFESWLQEYRNWLQTSPQGREERASNNNHGILYDLQIAAIHAYLGDMQGLLETFCDTRQRMFEHFNPDGFQPHEMERTISAHYCCFNLQSWVNIANLAKACGDDLWSFALADGRSIRKALEWTLPYMFEEEWPFEQIGPFDRDRFLPLYHAYINNFGPPEGLPKAPDANKSKPVFHPHDGIRPYWAI